MNPVPAEPTAVVKGVEMFLAGDYDGTPYTLQDLQDIVRNFETLSQPIPLTVAGEAPYHTAPVAIGHGEYQEILDRTDLPAAGRVCRLWIENGMLKADFDRVPMIIAGWINGRLYTKVSVEIYQDPFHPDDKGDPGPFEGFPGSGKAFRRVSLLGAEVPKVKGLADLPFAMSAETAKRLTPIMLRPSNVQRRANSKCLHVFSEVVPMDRATLIQTLIGLGYSQELCDSLPDEALAKLATESQALMAGAPTPAATPPAQAGQMSDDDAPGGDSDTDPASMSDATMPGTTQCGDTAPPAPTPAGQPTPNAPGTPNPSKVVVHFSERMNKLQKQADAVEAKNKAAERMANQRVQNEKKHRIQSFCERMVKEGKILPAQIDQSSGHPTLQDRLLRADCIRSVHKFSEKPGGALIDATELDMQMREIETGPALQRFAERMPNPEKAGAGISPERQRELLNHSRLGVAAQKKKDLAAAAGS